MTTSIDAYSQPRSQLLSSYRYIQYQVPVQYWYCTRTVLAYTEMARTRTGTGTVLILHACIYL